METDITKLLLSEWNAFLMAAVWIISALAERAFPHHFEKGKWGNRLEPVFPVLACTACAVFVPGPWIPAGLSVAQRLVLGVVLGAGAYNFAGLAKRVGLTPFITGLGSQRRRRSDEDDPALLSAQPQLEAVQEAVHEAVHEAVQEAVRENMEAVPQPDERSR